ncbi:MAG: putative metal-dependent hydrolase [Gemmatimonadales bacterium]|nr:putative metal-dependent hydrolase [Gemmatimonadales bacterium]
MPPVDPLRYPIGPMPDAPLRDPAARADARARLARAPGALRAALAGLDERQLEVPYRPGGWSSRQVAHHLADSHMNAFIRMKLALTEEAPLAKTYDEAAWAALPNGSSDPLEPSLVLLEALHARWDALLGTFDEAAWRRAYRHPELGPVPLDLCLAIYAWHGDHHVAQVTGLRAREGW